MRIPHAAIRGVAASAALAAGIIAGAPLAAAQDRAESAHKVEHAHPSKTRRRHRHRRRHGHRRVRCRIRPHARHRRKCRALPPAGRRAGHPKRRHRHHPRPVSGPPASTPASAAPAPAAAPGPPQPAESVGTAGRWSLSFDDEFNGSTINTAVWNEHDGWTRQNNVTDHAWNVSEAGGFATLTLASGDSGATIGTDHAVLAVGDVAEARVDFAGSGTTIYGWPAWWASGPAWPAAGENDIAEGLGTLTVNYHSPSGTHNEGTVAGDWSGAFHTYAIYRGPGYCEVYWDGHPVKRYTTDDNGQPEQLLFTVGAANTLQFGAAGQMHVDYVRVWTPD